MLLALRGIPSKVGDQLGEHRADVWGIGLIAAGLLVLLSFFDLSGPVGIAASAGTRSLFGMWAFIVPLVLIVFGLSLMGVLPKRDHNRSIIGTAIIFLGSLALFHLMTGNVPLVGAETSVDESGGIVGSVIWSVSPDSGERS